MEVCFASEPHTAIAATLLQAMPKGPQSAAYFLLWSYDPYSPMLICPCPSAEDPYKDNPYYYLSSLGHHDVAEHPRNKGEQRYKGFSLYVSCSHVCVLCKCRHQAYQRSKQHPPCIYSSTDVDQELSPQAMAPSHTSSLFWLNFLCEEHRQKAGGGPDPRSGSSCSPRPWGRNITWNSS